MSLRLLRRPLLAFAGAFALPALAAAAPPCTPCAGVVVDDPAAAARLLAAGPPLDDDAVLFVRWSAGLGAGAADALTAAGATPWLELVFETAPPLLDHLAALDAEIAELSRLAREAGPHAWFQLRWPAGESAGTAEHAFLVKRAAVAISGAQPDAQVVLTPAAPDLDWLRALYAEEVAAYVDGLAFASTLLGDPSALAAVGAAIQELDPGSSLVVEGMPQPVPAAAALVEAARWAEAGATITLFEIGEPTAAALAPLAVLAREFHGDLSVDPYSVPSGGAEAWSFVRGEDLGLRVVIRVPEGANRARLEFSDSGLRNAQSFDPATGEPQSVYGIRTGRGFEIDLDQPPPVLLLGLERIGAAELAGMLGVEEQVTVQDIRSIPVGEILRRLQAFEDSQARRLHHYSALNSNHLRFQIGTGAGSIETTFRGHFFFRQGEGYDWAWEEFLINGVKWRHKSIPEIPLIQPEKAATQPVEISFTRDYRYSLRGTAPVAGRDCWVIDFEPAVEVTPERTLYQGTVWVDREIYARVRTRSVQLGLQGDVLSNEETVTFSPVDAGGQAAPWSPESYFLPLRATGQQIWSVLSNTTVVERETLLTEVEINGAGFETARQALLDSETTMIRDTDQGMRYLVVDKETGERVVQEKLDLHRRFIVGGVFYDESLDYPLPLAGMNWLWFDWRGSGAQVNVFFAGALASVAITDPSFLGSKWDAGLDVFGLAIAPTDNLYRDGVEVPGEDVEVLSPSLDFKLGRPIGNFFKLELEYELEYVSFSEADDTDPAFVLPTDHLAHNFSIIGRYSRNGYRFRLGGSYNVRDRWDPWGLPGSTDFDPEHDTFETWEVGVGKTWHLPKFFKVGAEIEYVDGSRLDRFSKYGFGFFSDLRVHGYQGDKVRAEKALGTHLRYGFDVASIFRIDLVGDAVWATDETSGLDNELLGGVGVAGTFVGPWRTVINLDVGAAVTGPDDGYSVFLTVLKLFKR